MSREKIGGLKRANVKRLMFDTCRKSSLDLVVGQIKKISAIPITEPKLILVHQRVLRECKNTTLEQYPAYIVRRLGLIFAWGLAFFEAAELATANVELQTVANIANAVRHSTCFQFVFVGVFLGCGYPLPPY